MPNVNPHMPNVNKCRSAVLALFCSLLVLSCAKMGNPDGGLYDEDPPKVVAASPAEGSVNVSQKKITIFFDEYVKIENAQEKVVICPPQLEQADIKTGRKRISVALKDSLKPNMTYTIDFSDAIVDNNEGNPMGNYTYSFSTGERIDTFEVSGKVLAAENLEPVKGVLVGLYDNMEDTAFTAMPMLRISRTDSRGHFVIKGVAPGQYRIYALKDADGNFFFSQKSEMIAFCHDTIVPSTAPAVRQDTVWRDSLHIDSITRVHYIKHTPDDIVLLAFNETQTDRYFLKAERKEPEKFTLFFSYGSDTLPRLRGLNFSEKDAFVVETPEDNDTITYWLRDTALVNQDTLTVELTYFATDTTGVLAVQTDTLDILSKQPYKRRMKKQQEELEAWKKEQQKAKKRGEPYDSIRPPEKLLPRWAASSVITPDACGAYEMPAPLACYDTTRVHLYMKVDTLWYEADFNFRPSDKELRKFQLLAEWRPGTEYSLEIDSLAFEDIYGRCSDPIKQGFRVGSEDTYASVFISMINIPDTADVYAELLDKSDKTVMRTKVVNHRAEFYYVKPSVYYVRCFVDDNRNGVWDTGLYADDRQAEAVYYYQRSIECKANWDVTQTWDVRALPRDRQKPGDITKQKADQARKRRSRNAERSWP